MGKPTDQEIKQARKVLEWLAVEMEEAWVDENGTWKCYLGMSREKWSEIMTVARKE